MASGNYDNSKLEQLVKHTLQTQGEMSFRALKVALQTQGYTSHDAQRAIRSCLDRGTAILGRDLLLSARDGVDQVQA